MMDFFFANQLTGTNYGSGNSLEDDPLEKSGKDSRGIFEDFVEKDPLALPAVEYPREIPRVKFVNPIEKNGVIVLTLDDDTCKSKSKHFFLISFQLFSFTHSNAYYCKKFYMPVFL